MPVSLALTYTISIDEFRQDYPTAGAFIHRCSRFLQGALQSWNVDGTGEQQIYVYFPNIMVRFAQKLKLELLF